MKRNGHLILALAVLLPLLLAACQSVLSPTPTPAPTSTPMPTDTPAATHTPVPTDTPAPTRTPVARSEPDEPVDPSRQAERLGRGVNLGNALEAPREGEWGVTLRKEYFPLIAQAGFDTVRVPIRWSAHAKAEPPYTIDGGFFKRVDWVIDQATAQGLNVVINMHHYDGLAEAPSQHEERFLAMWRQIATRYRYRPDSLYLEPLNEPHDMLSASRWNELVTQTIAVIREVDGVHTIVVDSADWGSADALIDLRIPEEERNVVCSFHLYTPQLFTHQGADWMSEAHNTLGVQWPGPPDKELVPSDAAQGVGWIKQWFKDYNQQPDRYNPAGPRPILRELDRAVAYRDKTQCPLWLGEFGAYSKADMGSRARWTTFVREEAEARDISWSYWEFCAGFGVYDQDDTAWNEELLQALIPQE